MSPTGFFEKPDLFLVPVKELRALTLRIQLRQLAGHSDVFFTIASILDDVRGGDTGGQTRPEPVGVFRLLSKSGAVSAGQQRDV
jgi:hypothetical protein